MLKVTKIISIQPYEITARFSTNEVRKINFLPLIEKYSSIRNPEIFKKARLDDYPTIVWDNLMQIRELDGSLKSSMLDFSPETLYQLSVGL